MNIEYHLQETLCTTQETIKMYGPIYWLLVSTASYILRKWLSKLTNNPVCDEFVFGGIVCLLVLQWVNRSLVMWYCVCQDKCTIDINEHNASPAWQNDLKGYLLGQKLHRHRKCRKFFLLIWYLNLLGSDTSEVHVSPVPTSGRQIEIADYCFGVMNSTVGVWELHSWCHAFQTSRIYGWS